MSKREYSPEFFNMIHGSDRQAAVILGELFKHYVPNSVIDLGCGTAGYVKVAKALNPEMTKAIGVDGDYVPRDKLHIDEKDFIAKDLEKERVGNLGHFDLAITIEVAEHLSHSRAPSFVQDLCALSDVVLFSAAIPFQGGVHHINEQWPEYWAILFRAEGYEAFDPIRSKLFGRTEVEYYLRNNMLVFAKPDIGRKHFGDPVEGRALTMIDARFLIQTAGKSYPHMHGHAWFAENDDLIALQEAFMRGDTKLPHLKTIELAKEQNAASYTGDTAFAEIDVTPISRVWLNNPVSLPDVAKGNR